MPNVHPRSPIMQEAAGHLSAFHLGRKLRTVAFCLMRFRHCVKSSEALFVV